jgi:formamidopyrimidine-DNA glycosylase
MVMGGARRAGERAIDSCVPELPEVETIRRQLAPHLEGRTLDRVSILDPRWTIPQPPAEVAAGLQGETVARIARAGKYLIWELAGGASLLMHLRMTGTLLFDPAPSPAHTRVRISLSDGHELVYVDPRRFGTGHLLAGAAARDVYLGSRLGPEPLTAQFTTAYLRARARGRR